MAPGQPFVNLPPNTILRIMRIASGGDHRMDMSKQKPIEVITPPNMLKTQVGGALS